MNESSARLVRELLREPMDLAAIAAQFEPGTESPQTDEYHQRLLAMLFRLEQFGLIERN